MMSSSVVTKCEVLHHVSKIFDPLGLLLPVSFYGRVFIQKLWTLKQSWDQPLPAVENWNHVTHLFTQIPLIKIPRFVGALNEMASHQLSVFCDASIKAYAA